jgi:hypothetical protein
VKFISMHRGNLATIQFTICLAVCYLKTKRLTHKATTVSVLLYGCETSPLQLSEEPRMRVFENKVLRTTDLFGPKKDEITERWRQLHNDELHTLYSSPNISRAIKSRMRWAGYVARIEKKKCVPSYGTKT